jgi:two-component system NtrC family sensor kinase
LTAGIAHEIQNPLNFVNNFSELNGELLEEMEEALRSGDQDEAIALAKDISDNQQKINMHGKRAEGIVKGMLQHSRNNPGQKELTDINALCDEYLRLAYHGMRAKDKSFNAGYKLELDKSLPMLNVISQDIGRVLLNLINNAFYAVARVVNPEVIVTTNKLDGVVEICVKDNGQGIPDEIKDKIFQPFFTTKPTGQGTGLGLSLSYDIMNAHGGNIEVNSIKNKGTEFIITIPQDI